LNVGHARISNQYPSDLIDLHLIGAPFVEVRCPRVLVIDHLLRDLQLSASGGKLSEAVVINFAIIKGVSS
jgi:hypothetical protein